MLCLVSSVVETELVNLTLGDKLSLIKGTTRYANADEFSFVAYE